MAQIPELPDTSPLAWSSDLFVSRVEAAALSRAMGLPVSAKTLSKLFCVSSDGPPTVKFGRRARLRVGDFRAWLLSRTSAPLRSTSEAA